MVGEADVADQVAAQVVAAHDDRLGVRGGDRRAATDLASDLHPLSTPSNFAYRKQIRYGEHADRSATAGCQDRGGVRLSLFGYRNRLATCPAARKPFRAARVMGGLAKGLEVIRAFTREQPALTLSQVAAVGRPAGRDCAPLPAHARGNRLRHAQRPHVPAAAEGARARRRLPRIDEHRAADARRTSRSSRVRPAIRPRSPCSTEPRSSTWRARRCARSCGSKRTSAADFRRYATSMGRVLLAGLAPERLDTYFAAAEARRADRRHRDGPEEACASSSRIAGAPATPRSRTNSPTAWSRLPCRFSTSRAGWSPRSTASSHSRRITKAKLVRERLSMLQRASREISAELARVPGLSLSAEV